MLTSIPALFTGVMIQDEVKVMRKFRAEHN